MATSKIVGTLALLVVMMFILLEHSIAGTLPGTQKWIEYDNSFLSLTNKRTSTTTNKVQKFWVKIKNGQSFLNQNIVIDTAKQTEKIHIYPSTVIYETIIYSDFTKNLTIIKIPRKNICFLTNERPMAQTPHQMIKNLQQAGRNTTLPVVKTEKSTWKANSSPYNRTLLPLAMQKLCQNTPVHKVTKMTSPAKTRGIKQDISRDNSLQSRCSAQVCSSYTVRCCTVIVNGRCDKYQYFKIDYCTPISC